MTRQDEAGRDLRRSQSRLQVSGRRTLAEMPGLRLRNRREAALDPVEQLLALGAAPDHIVAAVRSPAKAQGLAARGVVVRQADYNQPETLRTAFVGAQRVLLISSSEVGQRVPQHQAVIDAAREARVKQLVYTSLLRADTPPIGLGGEHLATEKLIATSGLAHVVLHNGWYTENHLASVPTALQFGVFFGAAGDRRIASASRADDAAAAATVLSQAIGGNRTIELAGDTSYTLAELVAELNRQAGASVRYQNLPKAEFEQALIGAGLPGSIAALQADSDSGAATSGLFDDGRALSALIRRPTTPMTESMRTALRSASSR